MTPELRGKSAELASIHHRPRYGRLWVFLIFMSVFKFTGSYLGSETNQLKTFYAD